MLGFIFDNFRRRFYLFHSSYHISFFVFSSVLFSNGPKPIGSFSFDPKLAPILLILGPMTQSPMLPQTRPSITTPMTGLAAMLPNPTWPAQARPTRGLEKQPLLVCLVKASARPCHPRAMHRPFPCRSPCPIVHQLLHGPSV